MILTGKCKEAFIDYLDKTNQITIEKGILKLHWQDFPEKYIHALIIEWFDSVGIYISINYIDFYDELRNNTGFETYVTNKGLSVKFRSVSSRQEAIKQAIEKANEIYNSK